MKTNTPISTPAETLDLSETTYPGQRTRPAEDVENTEILKWASEAGPRQTADVKKAFGKVLGAGSGTRVLSSWPDGSEHESVQYIMGCPTDEEQTHKNKQTDALNVLHAAHGGKITRENCRALIAAALELIPTLRDCQPVRDERKSIEQHATEAEERKAAQEKREEKQAEEKAKKWAEEETAALDYPYLSRVGGSGGGKDAAKNIRLTLKKEFPGIRFSVTSDYSRVQINWNDGPTADQVEAFTNNFKEGHFDGMTDSYNYNSTAFNDAFGGCRYIFTSRNTRELLQTVKAALPEMGNLDDWETEQHKNRKARELISKTDLTGKGAFLAVIDPEEGTGCHVVELALKFEETTAPATDAARQTPATGPVTIEEHTHTKKGFQMWLVRLSDRVERDEFQALKSTAQGLGGWYSRKWGTTPAGFAFKTPEAAQTFADGIAGTDPEPTGTDAPPTDSKAEAIPAPYNVQSADYTPEEKEVKARTVGQLPHPLRLPALADIGRAIGTEKEIKFGWWLSMSLDLTRGEEDGHPLKEYMRTTGDNLPLSLLNWKPEPEPEPEPYGTDPHETTDCDTPRPNSAANSAEKLRAMADRLTSQIEDKTRDMTQIPTPKRNLEYKARMIEGHHLERVQTAARVLADGLEAGTLPPILQTVRTKKDLLKYTETRSDMSGGYYSIVDTGEFSDTSPAAVALLTLLKEASDPEAEAARKKETELKNKILNLTGQKIPGFFPTPCAVAEKMLDALDIQEGETVLEPSAGTGNLAERARDAGGVVTCVEIRPSLCEILELKGFITFCEDFTNPNGEDTGISRFDKAIMNPPFEKGQDADHIRAAYHCLKDGGRLAAIAGEGIFFRTDSKATAFRDWLEEVGGTSEQLPAGSFQGTGEVSQTGTDTRLVIITR